MIFHFIDTRRHIERKLVERNPQNTIPDASSGSSAIHVSDNDVCGIKEHDAGERKISLNWLFIE